MLVLLVGEAAEPQASRGERFQDAERRFVTPAVADMDAVLFERRAERTFEEGDSESDLCRAFGDNSQPREEGFRIRPAVPRNFCGVERTDLPHMIDIPDRGLRPGRDRCRAMRDEKDLRLAGLQFLDQGPLPIGFEPALDFIDERDRSLALVLFRDGECGEPPGPGSPACKRQLHATAISGRPDHRRYGRALPASDGEVKPGRQTLLAEGRVEIDKGCLSSAREFVLDITLRKLARHARAQAFVGEQSVQG